MKILVDNFSFSGGIILILTGLAVYTGIFLVSAAVASPIYETISSKLLAEVQDQLRSISQARQDERYLDRGIDLIYNTVAKDQTKLEQDLGTIASDQATNNASQIASDPASITNDLSDSASDQKTKNIVDGVTTAVVTTAPIFIGGPVGLAAGLDKVTAGALSASPFMGTIITGGIFGFTSGAGSD